MSAAPETAVVTTYPPAGLERRFYAGVLDRLVTWPLVLAGGYGAAGLLADGRVWTALLTLLGTVLVVWAGSAVLLRLLGTSPGKAVTGLRTVGADTGTPLVVGPAALRVLVLGMAGLPTFGLGLATLAQTALQDPSRQRRGWHDRLVGSIVVDVRPAVEVPAEVEPAPRQVVNLTAMRLAPAAAHPATPVTHRSSRATAPRSAAPAGASRHAAPDPSSPPSVPDPGPGWRVDFDTGESLRVEGLVLVGRRPEGRPGEPVARLVPLTSQDMSVSKTHAALHVAPTGALLVTDRGSTNGSVLIRSGTAQRLPVGRPTTLLPGDAVRFGDRTMTVHPGS